MHEFGVVEELLKQIEACCREQGGERVTSLKVALREGSGYKPDPFAFAFELLKKGTVADQAVLTVEIAPEEARCMNCGYLQTITEFTDSCSQCQSLFLSPVIRGPAAVKELVLETKGIEEDPSSTGKDLEYA